MTVRRRSSFQFDKGAKSVREQRRSSSPTHEVMEAIAVIRAEHDHQEDVAKEIALVSREEALQKIQSLCDDVAHTQHSHPSYPDVTADPGQVEISVAEPTSAIGIAPVQVAA